jgi:hypothetical protein
MIITGSVLNGLRTALHDEFRTRMTEPDAKPVWKTLATIIPSGTSSNTYGRLGAFPQMREWVGDRVIKDISEFAYRIVNQKWEATLSVDRTHIEDDNLGRYRVLARNMADEFERFMERYPAVLITGGVKISASTAGPFSTRSIRRIRTRTGPGTRWVSPISLVRGVRPGPSARCFPCWGASSSSWPAAISAGIRGNHRSQKGVDLCRINISRVSAAGVVGDTACGGKP